MADAAAVRKARILVWCAAALQVTVTVGAIVATAFGVRIQLPTWLIIGSSWLMFASTTARPARTKISLLAVSAALSLSAVIAIIVARR